MQWDSAEVNGHSKRRSERNIQRKGSSAGGFVPSSYKDREEQLAREDAEIIKRVTALKDAPALVERAARYLDREGTGPDYGGGRGLGTAGTALQAEDISKMTSQRKGRSVYGDKEERLARATREEGDGAHRKVDEKKIPGERNRAAETSAVHSTSIPAYLPPPAYPRRTKADEASEDDDELPMSTAPDSPPPAALSAVTIRRQASRERLRELRELSRAAATDRMQGATGKDQSAEAAFGELSWASFASLVLWKNASKSTLVFGAGTFFILASSNMRDLQTSPLTIVANFLLLYTAFNFVLTFSRRHDPSAASTPVTEASVLAAVRVALPFLTATKAVHARLFNGDTTTTLQVALCLWLLALCGSVFTFWDVTRIAFFAAFLLPRLYLAYAHHIQAAGRSVYHRCRQLVLSFPHKRKLAAVCALGVWHWLSLPTKCFLGFVLLVLLRRYQEGHAQQVDAGVNFVKKQARRLSSTHPTTRKPAVRRATLEEID